jgi:hypothetical protein
MTEEVTVNDIAALLEVSRKSAIQRMSRLVKKNQAIKLNMPTVGNPARFKLLVPKESLLHTQKFAGPKMNREIDWKKFCSDPFGMAKKGGGGMKAMYSVYDRNGDCFDFCDDEETEHSLDYEAEHDRLRVWQWSAERQSCGENNQLIAEFYQPRRFVKDFTL